MASCCDYIICVHSVNFVHLTCRCEMSCMSGNTDCGGPKFCILNTDTCGQNCEKKLFAKKSTKVDFLRELVIYEFYDSDKEAGTESHFTCLEEE